MDKLFLHSKGPRTHRFTIGNQEITLNAGLEKGVAPGHHAPFTADFIVNDTFTVNGEDWYRPVLEPRGGALTLKPHAGNGNQDITELSFYTKFSPQFKHLRSDPEGSAKVMPTGNRENFIRSINDRTNVIIKMVNKKGQTHYLGAEFRQVQPTESIESKLEALRDVEIIAQHDWGIAADTERNRYLYQDGPTTDWQRKKEAALWEKALISKRKDNEMVASFTKFMEQNSRETSALPGTASQREEVREHVIRHLFGFAESIRDPKLKSLVDKYNKLYTQIGAWENDDEVRGPNEKMDQLNYLYAEVSKLEPEFWRRALELTKDE